ncbi:MAG: hypothetical protein PHD93_02535 [Candidatus Pacebacteria bacterium]|nr:hypothetical protein [Candidatus Paceibacterota bacterium]
MRLESESNIESNGEKEQLLNEWDIKALELVDQYNQLDSKNDKTERDYDKMIEINNKIEGIYEKKEALDEFDKKSLKYMEKLLKEGADKDFIALGLAGIDTPQAWEMREKLLQEGASKGYIALGLAGDDTTFVWREIRKKKAIRELGEL